VILALHLIYCLALAPRHGSYFAIFAGGKVFVVSPPIKPVAATPAAPQLAPSKRLARTENDGEWKEF